MVGWLNTTHTRTHTQVAGLRGKQANERLAVESCSDRGCKGEWWGAIAALDKSCGGVGIRIITWIPGWSTHLFFLSWRHLHAGDAQEGVWGEERGQLHPI